MPSKVIKITLDGSSSRVGLRAVLSVRNNTSSTARCLENSHVLRVWLGSITVMYRKIGQRSGDHFWAQRSTDAMSVGNVIFFCPISAVPVRI